MSGFRALSKFHNPKLKERRERGRLWREQTRPRLQVNLCLYVRVVEGAPHCNFSLASGTTKIIPESTPKPTLPALSFSGSLAGGRSNFSGGGRQIEKSFFISVENVQYNRDVAISYGRLGQPTDKKSPSHVLTVNGNFLVQTYLGVPPLNG